MTNAFPKRIPVLDPPMSRPKVSSGDVSIMRTSVGGDPYKTLVALELEKLNEKGVEIPGYWFPSAPVFSKSVIGSTPLDLETKSTLSLAEIRSIATEIVDALDDPNFYFGSEEVSIVEDLLTRRLIETGDAT